MGFHKAGPACLLSLDIKSPSCWEAFLRFGKALVAQVFNLCRRRLKPAATFCPPEDAPIQQIPYRTLLGPGGDDKPSPLGKNLQVHFCRGLNLLWFTSPKTAAFACGKKKGSGRRHEPTPWAPPRFPNICHQLSFSKMRLTKGGALSMFAFVSLAYLDGWMDAVTVFLSIFFPRAFRIMKLS